MAARADLREEAVRLAELSLAPLLLAALSCQLGELDVDQRLERLRALSRACPSPLPRADGKEGVSGSSPELGSVKAPQTRGSRTSLDQPIRVL
jgi:hypothetical protein